MIKKKRRRSREFKNNKQVIDIEEARQQRKRKRQQAAVKKYKAKKPKSVVTERQAGKKARRRMVYCFIFFAIVCVIAASAFNIISLKLTDAKTVKEHEALLNQKAKLERIYSQVSSPEYIEQQARQQLKMIKPGEILYILPKQDKKTTDGGIVPK
jgi:cell division protein DivIC